MNKNWEMKMLGEISKISYGYTEKASCEEIGPKFLRITDIQGDNVDWEKVPFCKIGKNQISKYILNEGDIVFARTGSTTGKSFLIKEPPLAVFASYLIRLQILDFNKVAPEFLFSYFQTKTYWSKIETGLSGSAQGGFNATKLAEILIPVPSLSEQRRIVVALDETFAAIDKAKKVAEKNLQNAREIFESYLQSIFANSGDEWVEIKLEDAFNIKHGFAFKSEFFSDKGDYVLLTPGNFFEEGGYRDRGEKQKYYTGEIPDGYILKKDDLLIAMTEQAPGLLGSPIIIPESNKFLHNQRLGLIIYNDNFQLHTKFLFYLFNTKRIRSLIHESASGVKVRHTSPKKVLEITATIPKSLTEQQFIAAKLDALSSETKRLEEIYQRKLAALEELKKSVLQKAFSGELTGA